MQDSGHVALDVVLRDTANILALILSKSAVQSNTKVNVNAPREEQVHGIVEGLLLQIMTRGERLSGNEM